MIVEDADVGSGEGDGGCGLGEGVAMHRSTGSHCGGHATGWLVFVSLLATLAFIMCELKAHKAAVTPMRTSARKLEAP